MSKQTAVKWFLQELETEMQLGNNFNKSEQRIFDEIKQEALLMEREQIIDAYTANSVIRIRTKAEQYYNETYGGDNE
jgi:hypothetical protein